MSPHNTRRAFTLIELILVLSIMVVALAVAAPSLEGMISSRAIQGAVEKVRVELQKTRIEAIRSGQVQAVRCQIGSNSFSIQPWMKASDAAETSVGATVMTQTGRAVQTSASSRGVTSQAADTSSNQKTLEGNIQFADVQIASDRRSLAEQSGINPLAVAASGTSQAILLYPDGSSSTAHIVLQDARGRRMAVQLRGLMGQVNVVEMASTGVK